MPDIMSRIWGETDGGAVFMAHHAAAPGLARLKLLFAERWVLVGSPPPAARGWGAQCVLSTRRSCAPPFGASLWRRATLAHGAIQRDGNLHASACWLLARFGRYPLVIVD
jgi:hypothetical protein